MLRLLIIKTSSLGDVIHNLPAVSDIGARFPDAAIDWAVEEDFADVAALHPAVARVIHQDWLGYGKQKQFAAAQARHPWVLSLDADERVSEELKVSILAALEAPGFRAYEFPRRNRFMGRWLAHGEGYPDLSLRLFDRGHASWSDDAVHEKVVPDGPVGRLEGDLLHESQTTVAGYLEKQNRYTSLQAEALYRAGKRAGLLKLTLSPAFRFIKFYFLRLGFLDGVPGLAHIAIGCFNGFAKYAKLMERQIGQRRG